MVWPLTRNRIRPVQNFILKLVNTKCSNMAATFDGPRSEGRVSLTVVVMVVPMEKKPLVARAFAAMTKEFSTQGVALLLPEPLGLDDVAVGVRWEGEMTWLRGAAKHLTPLGGGFYQMGVQFTEMLSVGDYPELRTVSL